MTHYNGSPTVQTALVNHASAAPVERRVTAMVAAAPPSPTLLARLEELNIHVVHVYGLTETYGPHTICTWQDGWNELPVGERARLLARQGHGYTIADPVRVVDESMRDVPRDGETMGEVVMRGNNVMAGYFADQNATEHAFRGGWFHSGDLAVCHPDGGDRASRPGQGRDHLGRGEHLLNRGRADDLRAPGGAGVRRRGDPGRALGRAAEGVRDAQGRRQRSARPTSSRSAASGSRTSSAPTPSPSARCRRPRTGKVQKFALREPEWAGPRTACQLSAGRR